MYELTVQREFCAAHALMIHGRREPMHGHNWRVSIVVAGEHLDDDGLLIDFHRVERRLDEIIAHFHNRALNEVEPFDAINPTAERVAEHIGRAMEQRLRGRVRLLSASVTEAPGCIATWRPT